MIPDNRALWELVADMRRIVPKNVEQTSGFARGRLTTIQEYADKIEAILERPVVVVDGDDMRALVKLSRRCLHTAFVWNDHNFDSAKDLAKREAEELGIHSLEYANAFIDKINANRESIVRGKS